VANFATPARPLVNFETEPRVVVPRDRDTARGAPRRHTSPPHEATCDVACRALISLAFKGKSVILYQEVNMKINWIPFVIGAFIALVTFAFSGSLLLAAQVLFGWFCFVAFITLIGLLMNY
jgi:uncharacterized membrane protein